MALRRPPTRIELKTDDIEEYHKVRRSFQFDLVPELPLQAERGDTGYAFYSYCVFECSTLLTASGPLVRVLYIFVVRILTVHVPCTDQE